MSDDIQKETKRIHEGIVASLSFSEALAKRDAEIERLRHEVTLREQICADATLYARRLQEADDEIECLRGLLRQIADELGRENEGLVEMIREVLSDA